MRRAKNPTLPLARQVAQARLRRAGFTKIKSLRRAGSAPAVPIEHRFPEDLVEKLAGG